MVNPFFKANGLLRTVRVGALAALMYLAWGANSRAATYAVGPTRSFPTLATLPALRPGDAVEIDPGTYREVRRWTVAGTADHPITVRGVGDSRPLFDAEGQNVGGALPHPRAVFQVEADYVTLENIEFKNARNGDNGAGIRVTGGNDVIIRNCKITQCDMGIMCDNNRNLTIETSEIASNGTALFDGYSHNLYLGGNNVTLRFCTIHDALNGQNCKSRAHYTELLYCWIADSQDGEVGLVDAAETAAANSHAVMIGNVVVSKPRLSGYNSGRFIQFGQDLGGKHTGTLFAFNNTFVAGDGRIQFLSANASGANIVAANNIFYGSDKIVGTGATAISGSNNWLPANASVPAAFSTTTPGSAPGFVDVAARNFHLIAASPCRDKGLDAVTFVDGAGVAHPGAPAFEYVAPAQGRARVADGRLDLGAYEFARPSLSLLKLKDNDCVIDFTANGTGLYEVQRTSDLVSWTPMQSNIPGANDPIEVIDLNGASQFRRFYRVRQSP